MLEFDQVCLTGKFLESAKSGADRPALFVDEAYYSYQSLLDKACSLASLISRTDESESPLCTIYARRSLWAYAGILGTLLSGRGYVPLNPSFPTERNRIMLDLSGSSTVIADQRHLESLGKIAAASPRPLTIILPECSELPAWSSASPRHRVFCARELNHHANNFAPRAVTPEEIAYLLFTSGTTGTPKAIGIRHRNATAYIHEMVERYRIDAEDRLSQAFELTFDPSVHDLFVCWSRGACLYVPPNRVAMAPAGFIRDHHLTGWYSTPATAALMLQLRMLRPGEFPTLRWSLFSGEALPLQLAAAWQEAAPNSTLENLYGPTEATVNCTVYTYTPTTSAAECVNGIVPIGRPFGQNSIAIVNDQGRPVNNGEKGELLLAGGQLAPGYWRDPVRTAASFVTYPSLSPNGPWYRTGDLVTMSSNGTINYHGRLDDQIKIMGHRVELQEVEGVVRRVASVDTVVALGWPRTPAGADGVIVYLTQTNSSDEEILTLCKQRLPLYMVPKEIHRVSSMPLGASGKVDRKELIKRRENCR